MINPNQLLFIEPRARPTATPVIDELTRKMTAALRLAEHINPSRGWHTCSCRAVSDNVDHVLPNGDVTNSLSVHYLAHHRDEVPQAELQKVAGLNYGEAEPTEKELFQKWG